MRIGAYLRGDLRLESARARYGVAIAVLVAAFAVRLVLTPLTGWGAPFVLFFGATLVTSLLAGVGPAILSIVISLPIAAVLFVVHAGYPVYEAVFQSILYAFDGLIVIYMTRRIHKGWNRLEATNRELQRSSEERTRMLSEARRIADEREQALGHEKLARRQAESANEQLRESEERFRLTIEEAPIGMSLVALDGRFVRVNQALCEITGYSADELTKLTFQDITHPDDLRNDVDAARRLAQGKIPRYHLEKRYIRKDGSAVDVLLSVSVLRGPDGTPRYYISQIQDITERKKAETALRLSEAKFSAIISIAADAIISVDKDQRITIFNEGAERIFGYDMDEALGMSLEQLIPERFRAVHREHFARFAAGEETARAMGARREVHGLRKNGEEFPAEASISKVSVGGTTFFSVVLRDVTDRKEVEKALQRAVTARDDVLGIVAHDLRNPLNTIILQASLLERPEPPPDRRDQTPRLVITRSAKRMNHLIQDLLDVTAIEAGKLKIEHARVPAADLVRD
ncbi:MAG TPA: PAS domain S-box protein, partial [Gemmatimonadaceae bacterium]